MRIAVLYWSKSGNTEKVANAIKEASEEKEHDVFFKKCEGPDENNDIDYFDYDLIFAGSPTYQWLSPKPFYDFLHDKFNKHKKEGLIKLKSPIIEGKNAVMFCTYSGPHTGINEAIPLTKYNGQFFEHIGFNILGEWHIVGEFHGSEENSTQGKLGDIRGLPSREDLDKVKSSVFEILEQIKK
ncbi:MAG: nitric oxide synthase [Clostridiales bacterium]|nr:nitric oxide synthase [Clostridiales bacterium]MCF8021090.1 nitric oxide synthase [Clostridiales bacterium]